MRMSRLPSRDEAQVLALKALAFLMRDDARRSRFCAMTGMDLAALRAQAADAGAQVSVLDHLLADETLLLLFAADEAIDPRLPRLARMRLSGEDP